jgi:hypothetical protein
MISGPDDAVGALRGDVNRFLRMMWRRAGNFAKQGRFLTVAEISDVA